MLPSTALGKKQLLLLGKILATKRPDVASELMKDYFPKSQPCETDYQKIHTLYLLFCQVENLCPEEYIGPLYKTHKVDKRRQFISVILHLYHPDVFTQPTDDLIVGRGFCHTIAGMFQLTKPCVWRMIREAVRWEKQYDEYKTSVDGAIVKLKALVKDGSA